MLYIGIIFIVLTRINHCELREGKGLSHKAFGNVPDI